MNSGPASTKDLWDKAGIIAQALVPGLLAVFTIVYGSQEKRQRHLEVVAAARLEQEKERTLKAETVISLLPSIPAEADSLKIPMIAAILSSLGYDDVALRLATAQTRPTSSSVTVLRDLTQSDSAPIASAATQALGRIARSGASGDTSVAIQAVNVLRQTPSTEPGPGWAIVTGRYRLLAQAQAAADSSKILGFPADVFVRNNAVRTAIRFPTRFAARAALPLIRERVRQSAYGVSWPDWCPGVRREATHFVCGPSRAERPLD